MGVHAFDPSIRERQGQVCLYCEYEDSQSYIARPRVKKPKGGWRGKEKRENIMGWRVKLTVLCSFLH